MNKEKILKLDKYNLLLIDDRVKKVAQYIIISKDTVRGAALKFGVSKSTIHKDMTIRLKSIDETMYKKVNCILKKNKDERHIRGGNATKIKYENKRKSNIKTNK